MNKSSIIPKTTPPVELAAEFERYQDVADDYDVDMASAGLRYNFWSRPARATRPASIFIAVALSIGLLVKIPPSKPSFAL